MERLKIIKELNNVANILEDNGRISEASQITNVLIKSDMVSINNITIYKLVFSLFI